MKQHPSDIQQYSEPYILSAGCRLGQVWAMYIRRVSFPAMNSGPGGGRSSHQLSKPRGGKMRKMLLCFSENEAQRGCVFSSLPNFLDLVDILWYTYISYVSYVYYITLLWISKHPQQKKQPFSYFFVAPFCPTQKTSSKIRRFRGLLPRLVPSARPRNWNNKSKRRKSRRPWLRWIVGRRGGWDGDRDGDGWVDCL